MDNRLILFLLLIFLSSCNVVKDIFRKSERSHQEETFRTEETGILHARGYINTSRFTGLELDRSTWMRFDSLVFITVNERGEIQASGTGAEIIQIDRSSQSSTEQTSIDTTFNSQKSTTTEQTSISTTEESTTERNVRRSSTVPWIILSIAFVAAVYVVVSRFSPKILSKWK